MNSSIMKKLVCAITLLLTCIGAFAQERPKLVVGIIVDQMRWDYLYRYYEEYGQGGFKRMMNEGFNCENCMINYVPSITAVGHTSIFTGSVPSIHGIAGNHFMQDGKTVYCAADPTVQTVGSTTDAGKMSPRNMLVTTIGDELKTATLWKSKVIGVSFKDRAAIMPAGHSADAAYWFDKKALRFISSTYYMQRLPEWVNQYNKTVKKLPLDEIQYSYYGNEIVAGMAKAAIENEDLGQNGITDMLTVSFSCPDIVGHKYGTHHEKTRQQYVDIDRQLEDFFLFLDKKVGKGNYLVFLAADHGAANSISQNLEHKIPSGGFFVKKEEQALNDHLSKTFGTAEKLSLGIMDYKVVLNREAIAKSGTKETKVRKAVVEYFRKNKAVAYCVDLERVNEASIPSVIREKIVNGYHRERSGDIQIVLKPAHYDVWGEIDGGTSHGVWNPYDCHIPFMLMGWGIAHGSTQAACSITDIATTVCALIHVQMSNGCIGTPVVQVTK
ncbi:MAG: alkaline phosphatase family protein [Prevotella sp.]|nr:alkaline phosphatase family protein [Prevotella sp.]MDY6130250.1 alkaline phosphatase family protein [Prevotella sp.]